LASQSRTPYTILGCLTLQPMSGYDVKQFLERTLVHFWSESPGQIYPTLRRLEEQGLAEGSAEPGQRGKEKRVYRITDAGRETLQAWLRKPAEPSQPRYEHTLKLFFGHSVGREASLAHVERLRRRTEADLAHYREHERELAEQAAKEPDSPAPYWLVVLRGGIQYSAMALEWCDETEATLRALPTQSADRRPGRASQSDREDEE